MSALSDIEMKTLVGLSEEDFFAIFESKKLKYAKKHLESKSIDPSVFMAISKKRSSHLRRADNKITESLVDVLNPMSWCFLLVDTMFTLMTTITVLSFMLVAAGFAVFFAAVGAIYFMGNYKELTKIDEKNDEACQLLALKQACAEAYLKKHDATYAVQVNADVKTKLDKNKWQRSRGALGDTVLVTGVLFYTYYAITLGLTVAFAGTAIVALLTGPIGIGIALGAALLIGAYFGYKKYQLNKHHDELQSNIKTMEKEFAEGYKKCCEINHKPSPAPSVVNEPGQLVESSKASNYPFFSGVTSYPQRAQGYLNQRRHSFS